jgi:uncharacterized protein
MEDELRAIFGRPVDLTSWDGVEQSPNYLRRKSILSTIERVYAAGH